MGFVVVGVSVVRGYRWWYGRVGRWLWVVTGAVRVRFLAEIARAEEVVGLGRVR